MKKIDGTRVSFLLSHETIEQLDAYRERLGVKNRSDALRALIRGVHEAHERRLREKHEPRQGAVG